MIRSIDAIVTRTLRGPKTTFSRWPAAIQRSIVAGDMSSSSQARRFFTSRRGGVMPLEVAAAFGRVRPVGACWAVVNSGLQVDACPVDSLPPRITPTTIHQNC